MNKELRKAMIDHLEVRRAELLADGDDPSMKKVIEADDKLIAMLKQDNEDKEAPPPLLERIELRNYLNAYSQGHKIEGAEAELNQELSLDSVSHVPWQALAPTPLEQRMEQRTDDPTNVTIADWGKTINALLPRIFEKTDAGFLGVTTPGVRAGTTAYPVMTGGTTASMKAANAEVEADVATFTVETVTPTRLSARYLLNLEGLAAMGGMLESTLRRDLRATMGDQFDEQIINGDGTSPNVSGIFAELTDATDETSVVTFDNVRLKATDELDGKMARSESSVRILVGLASWKLFRSLQNTDKQLDSIEAYQRLGGRMQNSARIPDMDGTSKNQRGILTFEPSAAVAPIWQGITMIRDPYTNAAKAQVALTAHMLFGFAFKRKDGWKEVSFRLET